MEIIDEIAAEIPEGSVEDIKVKAGEEFRQIQHYGVRLITMMEH